MKRLLFIFLLLSTYYSYSCSCNRSKITQEEYDNYSLIFIGKIIEVEDCYNKAYRKFSFEIEQVFKGQTTKIISGFNYCRSGCGKFYKRGQKWLIYSNPEHGLIKDQDYCNQSTVITTEENEVLIGTDSYISKQDWKFEIDFLQSRITENIKIVNFQFIKIVPLLKNILILGVLILLFLLCFKFNLRLLPYSIGFGIISGVIYYLLIVSITILFQKLIEFKIIHVFFIFGFLLKSNFIYFFWIKDKSNFIKLIIFNYLTYISFITTTIYMLILNKYIKLEFDTYFYEEFFFILKIGILFSFFITMVLLIGKNIRLKIKKSSI